jgi:hypothetical protein
MDDFRTRNVSVRRLATVAAAAIVGTALALTAPAHSTAPTGRSLLRDSTNPPPANRNLGCADVATLDGTSDPGKNFLCGTSARDTIRAGPNDVVRAGGGADLIYTQNGGPNDVDGGPGTDRAWVDRWDTYKGIQSRTLGAFVPKARVDKTPAGFDYSLPNVVCGLDNQDHQMIRVDLPTGQRIMMAAFNANPGVVDWQYVAWSEVIMKYDRTARIWQTYNQTDWLWDRTYDLGEFKRHTPNEWHSFVAGQDDQEVDLEPFLIDEPGDYVVHFRLNWYPESAAAGASGTLKGLPGQTVERRAADYQGKFVSEQKSPTTGRPFYCRFP